MFLLITMFHINFISHLIFIFVCFLYLRKCLCISHVMFAYCRYPKLWHHIEIRFHSSLRLRVVRMKPDIKVPTSQPNLFYPTHSNVIITVHHFFTGIASDRWSTQQVDIWEWSTNSGSPYNMMIDASQWEIILLVGPHF